MRPWAFARVLWFGLLGLVACVDGQALTLRRFDQRPQAPAAAGWKQDVEATLGFYREQPVVGVDDVHLRPLFGGITTLVYFAPDLRQKLADQRTPLLEPVSGSDLGAACNASYASTSRTAGTPPLAGEHDDGRALWIALPIDPHERDAAARCDASGRASASDHFCMFGRLAVHGDRARPLVLVVHGMFDSSAQRYVRDMADVLFALGLNVLRLDMRDHGQTLRAQPSLPISLGALEGRDLLAVAALAKSACAAAVDGVGALGVSAGGLAVISAYAADGRGEHALLDRGAVALSPLLDVPHTLERLERAPTCTLAEAVELTWVEHLGLALIGGGLMAGGAATAALLDHREVGRDEAFAGGLGALAGLGASLALDAFADGNSTLASNCIARQTVGPMFAELLRARWEMLLGLGAVAGLDDGARAIAADAITLDGYLDHRATPYYRAVGLGEVPRPTARGLVARLLARPRPSDPERTKLLVLSAEDDPVTAIDAHDVLQDGLRGRPDLLAVAVAQGGHGAMWAIQENAMRALIQRFFLSDLAQDR